MDWWALVGILVTVLLAFGGMMVGMLKLLLSQNKEHIDGKFGALEQDLEKLERSISGPSKKVDAVERDLSQFKLHISEHYVHREDWIRVEGGRDIALRNINQKLEDLTQLAMKWRS